MRSQAVPIAFCRERSDKGRLCFTDFQRRKIGRVSLVGIRVGFHLPGNAFPAPADRAE